MKRSNRRRCPLLAQSRHCSLHRTCLLLAQSRHDGLRRTRPLSGVKRTSVCQRLGKRSAWARPYNKMSAAANRKPTAHPKIASCRSFRCRISELSRTDRNRNVMRNVVAVLDFAAHVLSPGSGPPAARRFDQRRTTARASGVGKGTMLALFADRPVETFMPKASSSCVMSSMTLIMPTHTMAGR